MTELRRYHAAVWDEPLVMELGREGRRGQVFEIEGDATSLIPESMRRAAPPELPELSEPDVLRHYLHLSQETLGMMGISLFGGKPLVVAPSVVSVIGGEWEVGVPGRVPIDYAPDPAVLLHVVDDGRLTTLVRPVPMGGSVGTV